MTSSLKILLSIRLSTFYPQNLLKNFLIVFFCENIVSAKCSFIPTNLPSERPKYHPQSRSPRAYGRERRNPARGLVRSRGAGALLHDHEKPQHRKNHKQRAKAVQSKVVPSKDSGMWSVKGTRGGFARFFVHNYTYHRNTDSYLRNLLLVPPPLYRLSRKKSQEKRGKETGSGGSTDLMLKGHWCG